MLSAVQSCRHITGATYLRLTSVPYLPRTFTANVDRRIHKHYGELSLKMLKEHFYWWVCACLGNFHAEKSPGLTLSYFSSRSSAFSTSRDLFLACRHVGISARQRTVINSASTLGLRACSFSASPSFLLIWASLPPCASYTWLKRCVHTVRVVLPQQVSEAGFALT